MILYLFYVNGCVVLTIYSSLVLWQLYTDGSGEEMRKLFTLLLLTVALVVFGCFKEEWEGVVYPNKSNSYDYKYIGVYESLESCRAASLDMLYKLNATEKGEYECGLNCKYKDGMGSIKVCEKTEQ